MFYLSLLRKVGIIMNYNPNTRDGLHSVEVALQSWEYRGSFVIEIGGNCKGAKILEEALNPDYYNYNITKNNCSFVMIDQPDDDNNYWFKCELKAESGNVLLVEDKCDSLSDYIVAVTIIDYTSTE